MFPWTAQLGIELNDPRRPIEPNNRLFGAVIHEVFNSFLKQKLRNLFGNGPLYMSPVYKSFFGLRSWILSSKTPPIVPNNRSFGAVIHEVLNSFSKQKLQNLMKKTPSLYDSTS